LFCNWISNCFKNRENAEFSILNTRNTKYIRVYFNFTAPEQTQHSTSVKGNKKDRGNLWQWSWSWREEM